MIYIFHCNYLSKKKNIKYQWNIIVELCSGNLHIAEIGKFLNNNGT